MTKIYDPQYETNVPHFNRKIVQQWVEQNDIEKVEHWLDNGRPHERLANDAIYCSIYQDNPKIIDLVYHSGWLSKEKILDLVLNKCQTSILPEKYGRDYFPNVRKWVVKQVFEEIKNDAITKKALKNFIFLISLTMSYQQAYDYGVDYSISQSKEALESLCYSFNQELYKLNRLSDKNEFDNKQKVISSCHSILERILFLIKNKTAVNEYIFYTFFLYGWLEGFNFIKPYLKEIMELHKINIANQKLLGLFVTEMALWKQNNSIEDDYYIDLLKLFIRSGLKEVLVIKRKEIKNEDGAVKKGALYDYFKNIYGVVGSIQRKNSIRSNLRQNQVVFYDGYRLPEGEDKDKISIDIREYVFIDHNKKGVGFDNKEPVSKEDILYSVKKYEELKKQVRESK